MMSDEKDENADRIDRFDSSVGRGDFETAIGVGRVIKGEDSRLGWCMKAADDFTRLG